MEEYDSSSSSEDEFYLMALGVVAAVSAKPKELRKRRIWVREIYQDREADGINLLVSKMRLSNRDSYSWISTFCFPIFAFFFSLLVVNNNNTDRFDRNDK